MAHQPEFDYLKTLGVFDITFAHIYIAFSEGYLIKFVKHTAIILSAAGLMIVMGIGMKYSRNQGLKNYIFRGFVLLTMGQYLYLLRDTFPNLFAYWVTGEKIFISRALIIIQTDILTFAGLAYFFLVLLKKIKLSDICILIIGIIMNFLAYPLFLIMKPPSNFFLSQLLGYFIATDAETFFPLSCYFVFVAFGYWIGGIYQKISNKDKFYNRILIFFFPIVAIYYYIRCYYNIPLLPEFDSAEHYCLSPGPDAIFHLMSNMVGFAIFYKMDKIIGKTPEFISHCGKNLNQYYMISYLATEHMTTFFRATRGENSVNWKYPDLFGFILLFLSRILIDLNDKYIHFTISTLKNSMRNIIFALIWIMSIICWIYIYPKVEVPATLWNNYLYGNKY